MHEGGKTNQAEKSFLRETRKVWSQAPKEIKQATTVAATKRMIKKYYRSLQSNEN